MDSLRVAVLQMVSGDDLDHNLTQAEALLRQAAALPDATISVRQNLALVLGLQGRIAEAERLARQDLPPQTVENNLAWLRAATAPASTASGAAATARSWESLRQP